MSKSSFVSFPTCGIKKTKSIGRKLFFFEKTIVKKRCGYIYFGYFPLELLGLTKKGIYSEDITICIQNKAIKQSAIRYLETCDVIRFGDVRFGYKCRFNSIVGNSVRNGFEDDFIFYIFVVSDIRCFLTHIMYHGNCMYGVDIYRTVALGPLVRLSGYYVGIYVINYDIHVMKRNIKTLDDKVMFTNILREKNIKHKKNVLKIYKKIVDKYKVSKINDIYKKYVHVFQPVGLYMFLTHIYHDQHIEVLESLYYRD